LIRKTILEAGDAARQTKQDVAQQQFEENAQAYQTARTLMIGAAVVSLVLAIVLSLVIARSFSVPLGQAVITPQQVAAGDLTAALDIDTKDEVGRMAGALNNALEKLRSTLEEVTQAPCTPAPRRRSWRQPRRPSPPARRSRQPASKKPLRVWKRSRPPSARAPTTPARPGQLASGSRDAAEQGQGVVSNAVTAMAEINAASAKIADIIGTIDEIAFQTNLLAVNAAVEAARAGEEGRGFAVVAAEVRNLAQRSAEAAKQIKALIQDSLRKVERGTDLVNKSGETLHGIVSSVKRVTDIVGEIAAAAGEQSTGIEQVNTAMTQMDQVTQSNSAQTEELSSTTESLSDQANNLMELVKIFTLSKNGKSARAVAAVRHSAAPVPASVRKPTRALAHAIAKKAAPEKKAAPDLRPAASPEPAMALAHAGGHDDASFEEF
jgi:methyl-accepting chemotaxis protein